MSSTTVIVPEGMSCVNAFRALWDNSQPAAFFDSFPGLISRHAELVSTAEKVAQLFKSRTCFDYEGGRMLKTDFTNFPELDVRLYDRAFGPGAAQRALQRYAGIPSHLRFDVNNSYKFADLKK